MSKTRNMNVSLVIWLFLVEESVCYVTASTAASHHLLLHFSQASRFPLPFDACVSSFGFSSFSFAYSFRSVLRSFHSPVEGSHPFKPSNIWNEIPDSNTQYTHICTLFRLRSLNANNDIHISKPEQALIKFDK